MANVSDKVAQIRQAVYGKDVRESIASGIEAINDETESTTARQTSLETTFQQLIINAGNSNAEIVASRYDNINQQNHASLPERLDRISVSINEVKDQLTLKRDINTKIRNSDLDISSDEYKIKLNNLSDEVRAAIAGTAAVNAVPAPGSINNTHLADKSVSKSKLADDVEFMTPFGGAQILVSDADYWSKSKMYFDYSGVTITRAPNTELKIGDSLLTITITNSANWLQFVNESESAIRAKAPDYKAYSKITAFLNYKYTKPEGTTNKLRFGVFIFYTDSTIEDKFAALNPDGIEHADFFTFNFTGLAAGKTISSYYIYVGNGGNVGDVLKVSKLMAWFGGAPDNPYALDKLSADINNKIMDINNKISTLFDRNWYSPADNIINGVAAPGNLNDFTSQGIEKLEGITNSAGNEYWWHLKCLSSSSTPFMQIRCDALMAFLKEKEAAGVKANQINYEVDIYLPFAEPTSFYHQFLSKTISPNAWYFFSRTSCTKAPGALKTKISGTAQIGDNDWNDLQDFLAVYIVFNTAQTGRDIYLGQIKMWLDDPYHYIVKDFIPGSAIIKGSLPEDALDDNIRAKLGQRIVTKQIPNKPLRIALTGSSITWGNGILDDSFVAYIDDYLRDVFSDTILSSDMNYVGQLIAINNPKLYKGTAKKIIGVNSAVSFDMGGKSLSIVQAIERNNANASIIDMYVDGELYDSFSNYNETPIGTETKNFTGDGSTVKFDLGRAYTYNHVVTVNGATLNGRLNTGGYGSTFDPSQDYMVIRGYGTNAVTGEKEVHHILWFKNAPANGATIAVTYNYGENIMYAKTTITELGEGINNSLESAYGDGNISFDPVNPSNLSSGLDFRYTDERAIKTWEFDEDKVRHFEFKIRGLDPRASETGTPYFIINFATNCMHRIMNAGIGGWTAGLLANDNGLRNVKYLMKFNPDIVLIEEGTNDDWSRGSFVATKTITGVTEAALRRYPTLWLKSSTYVSPNNYTIETSVLTIANATDRSITIDSTNVNFGDIKAGDILIIGNYHGDNREVQARVIDTWDGTTKTATFKKPLIMNGLFGVNTPADLIGREVRVKRIDSFINDLQTVVNEIRNYDPNAQIGIIDTGLSNFMIRLLIGYPEKISEFCKANNIKHVNVYEYLKNWQYSQKKDLTAYIGANSSTISTGASTYNLLTASGTDFMQGNNIQLIRNFSVKVNGVEVYGKDCYIEGGYAYKFNDSVSATELVISNWDNRTSPTVVMGYIPLKIIFTQNIPQAGAVIEVKASSKKWSTDDCHLAGQPGAAVFGFAIYDTLIKLINNTIE